MTESMLRGRTALVTGASGLIGREIALSLAAEGVNIIAHYRHSRKETETLCRVLNKRGIKAWPLQADFRDAKSGELLISRAAKFTGRMDILINSASLFTETTLQKLTSADLIENMQINAWTPFVLGRAFRRAAGRGGGAIVNLLDSRIAGYDWSHVGYGISKLALMALTRMMAMEFAPRISVNAVAPGLILSSADKVDRLTKNIPLRRAGEPDDVAQAVIFLLKSRCITGQVIWVDGGRHIRESLY